MSIQFMWLQIPKRNYITCDNIDRLNKYKQQITNNLQLYSCARSQHAHAII